MSWSARLLAAVLLASAGCLLARSGARSGDGEAGADGSVDSEPDGPDGEPPASCADGVQGGSETDLDCGGGECPPCADGLGCREDRDCTSLVCLGGTCRAATCEDGVENGRETGVDCGGACAPCPQGAPCAPGGSGCGPFGQCVEGACDLVGDGRDGGLRVAGASRVLVAAASVASGSRGGRTLSVRSGDGFEPGQRVLVHQSRGISAGSWELATLAAASAGELQLVAPLRRDYLSEGKDRAQVVSVPQLGRVEIGPGGALTARPWDGETGGLLVFLASSGLAVQAGGSLIASGLGFRGAPAPGAHLTNGLAGEGTLGESRAGPEANGSGGGGGARNPGCAAGSAGSGGGGGHAGSGGAGRLGEGCHPGGSPGRAAGGEPAERLCLGGGGGAGGADEDGLGAAGGAGGGLVLVVAPAIEVLGVLAADGADGGPPAHPSGCGSGGGGGGAGGSVLLVASEVSLGDGLVTARGGEGGDEPALCGAPGGPGADGRVYVLAGTVTGSASPEAGAGEACVGPGSCPASAAGTCHDLTAVLREPEDGDYWVDPDGWGPLLAHCDMTSDGGGYTVLRVDDPEGLGGAQWTYERACAARGMEVVVPRSRDHAFALQRWNGEVVPNLANVFPSFDGAQGLGRWRGLCRGEPCLFWLSETDDADCGSGTEPNGNNSTAYRLFRDGEPCVPFVDYGAWDDNHDRVAITGWVLCSPNDR